MQIIKLNINDLTPYEKNAKVHTPEQIEQIKNSIKKFGMNDPVGVWGNKNIVVEGHGRLIALKELGYSEVECIRLDHLSDKERKAYTLAHNKLTLNTDFDFDILQEELSALEDFDMNDFGFATLEDIDWHDVDDLSEKTYKEPDKALLQCPHCHHIDSKERFKKVEKTEKVESVREETNEDIFECN